MNNQTIKKTVPIVSLRLVRDNKIAYEERVTDSSIANEIIRPFFKDLDREAFYILGLSSSKEPVCINLVSLGTINSTIVSPREVFKPAILSNSDTIIVAHNHPSGNPNPSSADIIITKKLIECGRYLGIDVVDHLIIYGSAAHMYTSILSDYKSMFN